MQGVFCTTPSLLYKDNFEVYKPWKKTINKNNNKKTVKKQYFVGYNQQLIWNHLKKK